MDTPTTIDRISVGELEARYNIGRTALYQRRQFLGIETHKDGRLSYVSSADLDRLDALDRHLQSGGTLETFGDRHAITERSPNEITPTDPPLWMLRLLELLSRSLPPAIPAPPLPQETIEQAYQNGWLLSTSQLCELLGIKAVAGSSIERYGFRFTRSGKTGRQTAWAIEKTTKNPPTQR